ncbi:MAG: hypothetical protein BHV87_05255 [Clostridiales bacterium 36_14]|nr:MAG: hypothetical protein BHV87_05255 [Clostridiales bacterium 36_14]
MKMKRIVAWIIAVSLCITNSGLVYAAENTGMEESTIQAVQEEDSIKEKKDEEPAAECVSEDVQAEISNENELSGKLPRRRKTWLKTALRNSMTGKVNYIQMERQRSQNIRAVIRM